MGLGNGAKEWGEWRREGGTGTVCCRDCVGRSGGDEKGVGGVEGRQWDLGNGSCVAGDRWDWRLGAGGGTEHVLDVDNRTGVEEGV